MRIERVRAIYTDEGENTLIVTRKPRVFQKLIDTGAVIEQGITLETVRGIEEKDLYLPNNKIETNSQPLLPYMRFGTAFYPYANTDEIIDLFKAVKKFTSIKDNLDVRQLDSIKEKIDMISYNMFYGNSNGKTSAKLKEICFFLWLTAGILNTISGKTLLFVLNYLCAVLQIDYFTLIPMIMSSTISVERKKYILETIKNNCINPDIIEKDSSSVGLYTIMPEEEASKILYKRR